MTDTDKLAIHRSVMTLLDVLDGYIPRKCQRDIGNVLMQYFEEHQVELTSASMRREYEVWKVKLDAGILRTAVKKDESP